MEIFGLGPVYNGSLFRTSKENEYWWASWQNMTGRAVMENTRGGKWPTHHCASTMQLVSDNHLASFTHLHQWCQMVATFLIDFNEKQISRRDIVVCKYIFSDCSLVTWSSVVDISLSYVCRYLARYLGRYLARYPSRYLARYLSRYVAQCELGHQEGVGCSPLVLDPDPSRAAVSLLYCRHLHKYTQTRTGAPLHLQGDTGQSQSPQDVLCICAQSGTVLTRLELDTKVHNHREDPYKCLLVGSDSATTAFTFNI